MVVLLRDALRAAAALRLALAAALGRGIRLASLLRLVAGRHPSGLLPLCSSCPGRCDCGRCGGGCGSCRGRGDEAAISVALQPWSGAVGHGLRLLLRLLRLLLHLLLCVQSLLLLPQQPHRRRPARLLERRAAPHAPARSYHPPRRSPPHVAPQRPLPSPRRQRQVDHPLQRNARCENVARKRRSQAVVFTGAGGLRTVVVRTDCVLACATSARTTATTCSCCPRNLTISCTTLSWFRLSD